MTEIVRTYHDATKHHFNRFARSLGYLDWATQPNPFRHYDGAPSVDLWRGVADRLAYDDLFAPAAISAGARSIFERVSVLLRYSLGLSAWKQFGRSRWSLRVNPSSGNLHPTEAYVIALPLDRDRATQRSPKPEARGPASLYHYAADRHACELRASGEWGPLASDAVFIALTTVYWREAWKYGERAFRYCQHDTGHAIAAVALAARLVGCRARVRPEVSDAVLGSILGLDRDADFVGAEREAPQCLIAIVPEGAPFDAPVPNAAREWHGRANVLSHDRVDWPIIDEVANATRTPTAAIDASALTPLVAPSIGRLQDAGAMILQRRSAVALDGQSRIDRDTFVRMLARVMPCAAPPWDALWWTPRIHLALFVHRVDGVPPGLYFLVRARESEALVRAVLQREFTWAPVDGVADALPLFELARGDCRRLAQRLSCDQEIAADGFFSLAMIAEFDPALQGHGAWFYKHLFWESGAIGQVLYLEAEAAGARATGIGCFYDDPVHETLGIFSHQLQSLYHFTVGMPVDDPRLTTEPGYQWERVQLDASRR